VYNVVTVEVAIHAVIIVFAALIVLAVLAVGLIDTFGRVDYLKQRWPSFAALLEKRGALAVLALASIFLLIGDTYELASKEAPTIPAPLTCSPKISPAKT
jgi:hypothetical protein